MPCSFFLSCCFVGHGRQPGRKIVYGKTSALSSSSASNSLKVFPSGFPFRYVNVLDPLYEEHSCEYLYPTPHVLEEREQPGAGAGDVLGGDVLGGEDSFIENTSGFGFGVSIGVPVRVLKFSSPL